MGFDNQQLSDRKKFEELLPFYLNSTLSHSDREFCQSLLKSDPAFQKSLILCQIIQNIIRSTGHLRNREKTLVRLKKSLQQSKNLKNI